ncbi:MAG: hypothetical protein KDA22_10300 [Phycisphaerales bacterium]|nr:hypothetical protein [Phycisphaerales bacterium]
MEPVYMNENRYSYLVGSWRKPATSAYVVETPESQFEQNMQSLFLEGQAHLHHEEYTLALNCFQEARALILHTVHPALPLDPSQLRIFEFPMDVTLVETLVGKTADILLKMTPVAYEMPASIVSDRSLLSTQTLAAIKPIADAGMKVTSFHATVQEKVAAALDATVRKDFKGAVALYQSALEATPAAEAGIRGGLLHDLAVLSEKADDRPKAQQFARQSIETFGRAGIPEAKAQALATASGIFARSGNTDQAGELGKELQKITSTTNLNSVVTTTSFFVEDKPALSGRVATGVGTIAGTATRLRPRTDTRDFVVTPQAFSTSVTAPELIGMKLVSESVAAKALTINGSAAGSVASIGLDKANAAQNTTAFLKNLAVTKDVGLLTNWFPRNQFVAYLPHLYFYVLPMAIGDCHAGMGNLPQASQSYASVLPYPYINQNYEIVKVWTRLAQTFLDRGDEAYRNAKDNPAAYGTAKAHYENIALANKSLPAGSPLYADAKFAGIKARVTAILNAADPAAANDNPAIVAIVVSALAKLQQLQAGLNFFGFGPDYVPPFSFEYLQNTARYFAQHASETEQRYIQYKSQAENEEFRRDQMAQQAEVARQSVILEQRGVAEAQRGVDVANAGLNYADVQLDGAVESKNDFENVRWELLEIAEAEAWANASSVDRDDQVKLTWTGNYYNSDHKRRNVMIKELAYQRTRISHELEEGKLERAIESAQAYKAMAEAQVAQAAARVAVAEQRVKIAQLQQKHAEENRDFLDMREFGAQLWYELAQQAKRIKQRYLDMATEIAFLMERAYNAETERGLSVIRYDYQSTASGNLMGADLLMADIDSFTFDHVTTTKTKKLPVKRSISLADSYAMSFQALKTNGHCLFETSFADFDRQHPGLYLAKIRNVELVFVGIAGATSIAGTLRNIGVSRFRRSDGTIVSRMYPADVMSLSQYEIRQDALAFRFNPNDLRLFENNGIDTLWQLDLPLDANDFDFNEILDVHLVLYYDGFFDPELEANIREALPATGSASRVFSMRLSFPDELFYLKNQGQAELLFEPIMFPRNQTELVRTTNTIKVTGDAQAIAGLTIRLTSDAVGGELVLETNADGEILDTAAGSPLATLKDKPMLDRWSVQIRAEDNPQLVADGTLDLGGIEDVLVFSEYAFGYR